MEKLSVKILLVLSVLVAIVNVADAVLSVVLQGQGLVVASGWLAVALLMVCFAFLYYRELKRLKIIAVE